MRGVGLIAVVALLGATRSEAGSQSCLGTGKSVTIIDETLAGIVNPEGFENQVRISRCNPLTSAAETGLLHDYDGVDVGFFNYTGPIYMHQGAYVHVIPLSFLELKAAASGVVIWPLPLDGAGFYALRSYAAPYWEPHLKQENARFGSGANLNLMATLRGAVPLWSTHELYVADSFTADYWYMDGGRYYWNPKRDLVLARSDLVLNNFATVLLQLHPRPSFGVSVGVVDELNVVPASGAMTHLIALFVSVPIHRHGALRDIEPFLRAGWWTHHPYRSGFQLLLGVSLTWGLVADGPEPARD